MLYIEIKNIYYKLLYNENVVSSKTGSGTI